MEKLKSVLLEYLETKYKVTSAVKNLAKSLLEQLEKGSVCLKIENPCEKEELELSKAVGKDDSSARPLIFDGVNLYIQRYFIYQSRVQKRIDELEKTNMLHIITGGPGTGKTTSLAGILKNRLKENILIAAPTGKAALRIQESLLKQGIKLEAKTLHRLLGYINLSVNFKHSKENPLKADLVAIDECSMVDLPMMSKLLEAVPDGCDLYLLGDKNQLVSVEAGSVFADICEKYKTNKEVYTELTKNWRAIKSPGIIKLSKEILDGSIENFDNENVRYLGQLSFEALLNEYEKLFSASNEEDALESLGAFQILCAVKNGRTGTENINKELLCRSKEIKSRYTPIIICENDYYQNLFNGDIGIVEKEKETAYFTDAENIKTFPLLILPKFEDAFAITIHKSQGSEYKKIAVIYPDTEREDDTPAIFTRELLYTAITRAKEECQIYGSLELLKDSCKRQISRASGVK